MGTRNSCPGALKLFLQGVEEYSIAGMKPMNKCKDEYKRGNDIVPIEYIGEPVVIQKTPFQSLDCLRIGGMQYRVISFNSKGSIVCGDFNINNP